MGGFPVPAFGLPLLVPMLQKQEASAANAAAPNTAADGSTLLQRGSSAMRHFCTPYSPGGRCNDNGASHHLHIYSGNHRGRGFSSMSVRLSSATSRAQHSPGEQHLSSLLLDSLRSAYLRILCSAL